MADNEKKGFVAEFKEFISRGNVIDMAVGIVIGSAFTAIVNSLVDDIVMPAIGYLIGGMNFEDFKIKLPEPPIPGMDAATINYGVFIQTLINFLVIALVIFLMLKGINKLRRKSEEAEEEPEPSAELTTLEEIRDLLKASSEASEKKKE